MANNQIFMLSYRHQVLRLHDTNSLILFKSILTEQLQNKMVAVVQIPTIDFMYKSEFVSDGGQQDFLETLSGFASCRTVSVERAESA